MKTTNPSRRSFLKTLIGSGLSFGSLWIAFKQTTLSTFLASGFKQRHSVKNQPPLKEAHSKSFAGTQSVRCLVVGDWGTGDGFQKRVAGAMAAVAAREKPQCIVSTGDNFYPIGVLSSSDKQFTTKWKNMYSDAALQLPWYLVLGNHDYAGSEDSQVEYSTLEPRWHMPARYFNFSQQQGAVSVEFFMLDTEMLSRKSESSASQAQLAWLEKSLKESKATWKVAVGHHMIRSYGAYGDQVFMLRSVKPLLDRFGVDIFMNGHDHDLQYIKSPDDHFACIISGGGGGSRNTSYGPNTRFAATNGGFAYLAFDDHSAHLEYYDPQATAIFADDVCRRN